MHSGELVLESVFGRMTVREGDYVVVPSSTTHQWLLQGPVELVIFEARGHVDIPRKYLTERGQLLEGAPFSERDLRGPDGDPLVVEDEDVPVLVRTRNGLSRHVHANHPFDVVGWDGCNYPFALSIHDFEPIVGRVHQPPPVHQTFTGPGIVICSFVPRLYDFDPDAVKVPYHHSNVDSDEVLFYSGGDFMSRAGSGIGEGLDQPASRGVRARAAAGLARAQRGQGPHRRARGDDGHVQAARAHRRGAVGQRSHLPLVLGAPCLTRGRRSPTGPTSHSRTFRSASLASVPGRLASLFASAITWSTWSPPASPSR